MKQMHLLKLTFRNFGERVNLDPLRIRILHQRTEDDFGQDGIKRVK